MDDQRTDREGGGRLTFRLPRMQIGLRLMLLLVALICVLVACYPPLSALRHVRIKERLSALDGQERGLEQNDTFQGRPNAKLKAEIVKAKAEVVEQKRRLGEK
jgi:hypothetical protein